MTELLYQTDSYVREFEARVVEVRGEEVALDETAFFPGGGGQPHDVGHLVVSGVAHPVVAVHQQDGVVWHRLGDGPVPDVGTTVKGSIDWSRRFENMRSHTAAHVVQAVIAKTWGGKVTGFSINGPLSFRNDFSLDPTPDGFKAAVEELVNEELRRDLPVTVSYLDAGTPVEDELVRTEVSLVPSDVDRVRVVEVGDIDRQADGGTHVRSTGEVGLIRVVKLESKGRGNKRLRIEVLDA